MSPHCPTLSSHRDAMDQTKTIKPDESIPQFIERIKDNTIKYLDECASLAYSNKKFKLHKAIRALIKKRVKEDEKAAFEKFVADLETDKELRSTHVPKILSEAEFQKSRPSKIKNSQEELKKLVGSKTIDATVSRAIVHKMKVIRSYETPYYKEYQKIQVIIEDMRGLLDTHTRLANRELEMKNIIVIFKYIIAEAKHFVAHFPKFRDTLAMKILELQNEEIQGVDLSELKPLLVAMKEYILTEVPTSALYIPASWEIQIDGLPDEISERKEEQDMQTAFASLRKHYTDLLQEAMTYTP